MIQKAEFYTRLDKNRVQCLLCPALCKLKPDQAGICHNRFNREGDLYTNNFGETVTVAIDPIEKKPLYHFRPETDIVSIGPNGCTLGCMHCQNWQISQTDVPTSYIAPEELPALGAERGSIGIAYTYSEPMIWFEYIKVAAPLVRKAGLVNVMVSNGYVNPEPLGQLLPVIDAFNIDLKGMRPDFYRRICKGKLEAVLEAIKIIAASDCHLEITNLIIPGLNDEEKDFRDLCDFIGGIDKSIPLHLSAYHPSYKLQLPRTPAETLEIAYKIASEYLDYVYVGNMELPGCSDSRCPDCGSLLVRRLGYKIEMVGLTADAHCKKCGEKVNFRLS